MILASVIWSIATTLVSAQPRWTADDVRQAMREARHSREVTCIFTAEIGGSGFNPYTTHGDAGVVGPGGLSSAGLLPQFRSRGYDDPYDPFEVSDFIDTVLDGDGGGNWPYLKSWIDAGRC